MIVQRLFKLILAGALIMSAFVASEAADELLQFSSEEQRERYVQLLDELRCPQCQNQNLLDSDAPLAKDLRDTVYGLLQDDMSNSEITDYLIERYGDFITYMPRFKRTTWALWLTPLILVLFAGLLILVLVRRQRQQPAEENLSPGERQQLDRLLNETDTRDTDSR